jgi:hypothetical protein
MDEANITRAIVAFGMRGVYGASVNVLGDLAETGAGPGASRSYGLGSAAAAAERRGMFDLMDMQATVYKACDEMTKEAVRLALAPAAL